VDADRFDALLRVLSQHPTRRGALSALGGLSLALLLDRAGIDAKRKKKKKKKKKNSDNNTNAPPPPPPPPPSCSDGIKNADETDVDCGGSCTRCGNGQTCGSRNDCFSGLCTGNVCQACTSSDQCGNDGKAICSCEQTQNGTAACSSPASAVNVGNCAACPPGTNCIAGFAGFVCKRPCGAG
jgi:hypothetical protein